MKALAALLLATLALAGCADEATAPQPEESGRQSIAAEEHVRSPVPFATDLTVYGMSLDGDGELAPPVTSSGFSGTSDGNLTELRIDVTITPPAAFPVRVCLVEGGVLVPEVPCAEGTGEIHIVWDNATAGIPGGLPGTYRGTAYSSATPQVLGLVEQHVEGVTLK